MGWLERFTGIGNKEAKEEQTRAEWKAPVTGYAKVGESQEGIVPPEINEEVAKFEQEQYKGSDLNNVDTISPGAIDDSVTGATAESEVDRTVETKESEKTITPVQAHENWRESWYAKYSKAIDHGLLPTAVTLLSVSAVLTEKIIGGSHGIVGNSTGIETLAMMFGPGAVAEIADLIPRAMKKVEEIKETRDRHKEYYREYCLDMINTYQDSVNRFEEHPQRKDMDIEYIRKNLKHWESIYNKKFGEA